MAVTNNPLSFQDFSARKLYEARLSLAANAGASEVFALDVGTNRMAVVRAVVRCAAGQIGSAIAVTANTTTDLLTKVAHGITSGTPVIVGGTAVPTGTTAGTIYYANAASADTIGLYDTSAHAVAGGATGLVDLTAAGTAVTLTPTVIVASYNVFGTLVNRLGYAVLVGSPVVDANETQSGWDCTIAADATNKRLQIKVTPDVDLATRVVCMVEAFEASADVLV